MSKRTPIRLAVLCLLVGVFTASSSFGQVLYGISFMGPDDPAVFNTIDTTTGVATLVGPVGFERCSGMDADSAGTLYAACERSDGSNIPVLITIDPVTGAGTEIGPTGLDGATADLSFRSDGVLFAFDAANDPVHTLATINTVTGAATVVGDTGLSFAGGNAMSFDAADTLFHSQFSGGTGPDLNTLNQGTGAATFLGEITTTTGRLSSMDLDPVSGVIYAALNEGGGGGGPNSIVTLDTGALTTTLVGVTTNGMDAVAFVNVASGPGLSDIPTLNSVGLIGLILLLAAAGAVWLRRQ